MEVTGPGSVGEEESGRPAECLSSDTAPETIPGLELSGDEDNNAEVARVPKRVSDDPVQRSARLARIQAEIEAGTYESPEKLEIAVERLLREIG